VLDALGHDVGVAGAQHHRGFAAIGIADSDVELAVQDEKELIGVLVDVPDVFAQRMCDPYVVVVHPSHDPRAVDVVEGGQGRGQVDGSVVHGAILVRR